MRTYQDSEGSKYKPFLKPEFKDLRFDTLTVQRIYKMHPLVIEDALETYFNMCLALQGKAMPRFSSTYRTFDEQNRLYAKGRTKLYDSRGKRIGKVTNVKGGWSYHNYGLAFDICLLLDHNLDGKFEAASWNDRIDWDKDNESDWMECVKIAKSRGWAWGGDWKSFVDKPHFQKTFGYTTRMLNDLYTEQKIDENGYVILNP